MPINNEFELYYSNLDNFGRKNLEPTAKVPTIMDLLKEGDAILQREQHVIANPPLKPIKTPKVPKTPAVKKESIGDSANPFCTAKKLVLAEMDASERNRILKMEADNDIDNPRYDAFVKNIIKRAETLF